MSVVAMKKFPSLRDKVSPEEWQARVELAACYRLAHHFGWSGTNLGTHLSARVPGEPDKFLLNPVSIKFDLITASSLIKVDFEGNRYTENPYRVNSAGIALHGGAYQARPDVNGVLHTHSENGVAISCLKCGLLPISMTASRFHKRIGYFEYRGPGENRDELAEYTEALGPHMALIMRNHGLITVGRTIGESMVVMTVLEQAIAIQLKAMATGAELNIPSEELMDITAASRDKKNERNNEADWRALLELADRLDPSFRE